MTLPDAPSHQQLLDAVLWESENTSVSTGASAWLEEAARQRPAFAVEFLREWLARVAEDLRLGDDYLSPTRRSEDCLHGGGSVSRLQLFKFLERTYKNHEELLRAALNGVRFPVREIPGWQTESRDSD